MSAKIVKFVSVWEGLLMIPRGWSSSDFLCSKSLKELQKRAARFILAPCRSVNKQLLHHQSTIILTGNKNFRYSTVYH